MDPQQELFTALLTAIKDLGYDVYDGYLPPKGTAYPFIYLSDSQQVDAMTKTAAYGTVYQTVDVWHNNPKNRGTVSGMLLTIKQVCISINHTENFTWTLASVNQRILPDNTTTEPLLHGMLEVGFRFS